MIVCPLCGGIIAGEGDARACLVCGPEIVKRTGMELLNEIISGQLLKGRCVSVATHPTCSIYVPDAPMRIGRMVFAMLEKAQGE